MDKHATALLNSDQGIQSDTPSAIPRSVLCKRGGEVRDEHGEVHCHRLTASIASVRKHTRLWYPYVVRFSLTPPRVSPQFPQVKMCLPELDVNGRFDWRHELCFSTGNTERVQKRADDGAVTRRLESVGKQQARLDAILPHCCAIFSFGCRHAKPSLSTQWTPVAILP
jgi:hypothetical protein